MDYKQLKLLYENIYNTSLEIDSFITNEKYDDIMPALNKRDKLISHLTVMKNEYNENEKLPDDISNLIQKWKIQETSNIKRLNSIKDSLKVEIDKTNKQSKLLSAYASVSDTPAAIVDIME